MSPGHQCSRAPEHSAPQASSVRLRIRCCVTCPRSLRKTVLKQDKGRKASTSTTTQQGKPVTLTQSFAACHWAKWLCDHTKNTLHSHQFFTSLLSFFPAGQNNYWMCMQRHNKIGITRMVNLHFQSTSSLLFSPKIEIGREKPHKLWNLAGTAGNLTLSHRALSASILTASFYCSHIQHIYLPVLFQSPKLALEILFFLCSL